MPNQPPEYMQTWPKQSRAEKLFRLCTQPGSWNRLCLLLQRKETLHVGAYVRWLDRRNRRSSRPATAPGGPVVSLTTYGSRLASVHYAVESIAAGSLLPSRLLLWLDDERAFKSLPDALKRLEARGVEIRLTDNYGPHTKYYPALSVLNVEQPLVTADDDMIYTRQWLARLWAKYHDQPGVLHCYRAHRMRLESGRITAYASWMPCSSTRPSYLHFATAVSGNLLPPPLLRQLRQAGTSFQHVCPKADDIWIHVHCLRSHVKTRQLSAWGWDFPSIPGTQELTLNQENLYSGRNDEQIAKAYTEQEISLLSTPEMSELPICAPFAQAGQN